MANAIKTARKYNASGERKPREERWAEILDVAATVFAEKGYDGTSLQEIATRTGILKGSIYYYIKTKADMLGHLIQDAHEKGMRNVQSVAFGSGTADERLALMIHRHAEFVCVERNLTLVYVNERKHLTPAQIHEYMGDEHSYRRLFAGVIEEGQREGLFNKDLDPKLAALCLLSSLNSLHQWFKPNGEFSIKEICDHLVLSSLHGLLA